MNETGVDLHLEHFPCESTYTWHWRWFGNLDYNPPLCWCRQHVALITTCEREGQMMSDVLWSIYEKFHMFHLNFWKNTLEILVLAPQLEVIKAWWARYAGGGPIQGVAWCRLVANWTKDVVEAFEAFVILCVLRDSMGFYGFCLSGPNQSNQMVMYKLDRHRWWPWWISSQTVAWKKWTWHLGPLKMGI